MPRKKKRNRFVYFLIVLGVIYMVLNQKGEREGIATFNTHCECQNWQGLRLGDSGCVCVLKNCVDRGYDWVGETTTSEQCGHSNWVCNQNCGCTYGESNVCSPYDLSNSDVCPHVCSVCLNSQLLCTDTFIAGGNYYCDVNDFQCNNGCTGDVCFAECYSECMEGYEYCCETKGCTDYEPEGDPWECDGGLLSKKDTCSSSEYCEELSYNYAKCTAKTNECSSASECCNDNANTCDDYGIGADDEVVGNPYCQNGDVYVDYYDWDCDTDYTGSTCSRSSLRDEMIEDCGAGTCSNGQCITPDVYTCSDSDGGYNYDVKGTVTLYLNGNVDDTYVDACIDSVRLREGVTDSCDTGLIYTVEHTCSWQCQDGACVACTPDCTGKNCGDDGCGGTCGTCSGDDQCVDGQCTTPCTHECEAGTSQCYDYCETTYGTQSMGRGAKGGGGCTWTEWYRPCGNFDSDACREWATSITDMTKCYDGCYEFTSNSVACQSDEMVQEYASSYTCDGTFSPAFPCENIYDGDWYVKGGISSPGYGLVDVEYNNDVNGYTPTWRVKDAKGTVDLDLNDCKRPLTFQVYSYIDDVADRVGVKWQCEDSSNNLVLLRHTYKSGGLSYSKAFEEAVVWSTPTCVKGEEEPCDGTIDGSEMSSYLAKWLLELVTKNDVYDVIRNFLGTI